ncbi:hypothetical protein [Streptomyces sp. NPDC017520]|uniref:hypothetical protein n=1 Tax=Streptomyces sp. NPDC017520 TaxID=3364998 RepID=UPI0037AFB3E3
MCLFPEVGHRLVRDKLTASLSGMPARPTTPVARFGPYRMVSFDGCSSDAPPAPRWPPSSSATPTRPAASPATAAQGPGPTSAAHLGNGPTVSHSEGHLVGYRYYDAQGQSPLFPFGHGLSCTTFNLGSLEVAYDAGSRTLTAAVTLTNSGNR